MSDNVTASAGTADGAIFATDQISTIHWPFAKLAWGPRDTANEVDKASGKSLPVQGEAAQGASTTGNPVMVGLEARTSDGTAVTSGQVVRPIADSLGKAVVLQGATHDQHVDGTANFTGTTVADIIAAAGAGVRIAVTGILVTNAHATVGTKVNIRDGATVKAVGYAAAAGGGFTFANGGLPIFISTANTAVRAVPVTTGSDIDVTISGYKILN
jgi:hypothetical protein